MATQMTTMPRMHFIEKLAALLVVLATCITMLVGKPALALGVAIGGLVSIANLYLLRVVMGAIFSARQAPRQTALALLLVAKFALMGALVYLLMTYAPLDPAGLLLGVSAVVLAILVEGFRLALRASAEQAQEHSSDG